MPMRICQAVCKNQSGATMCSALSRSSGWLEVKRLLREQSFYNRRGAS